MKRKDVVVGMKVVPFKKSITYIPKRGVCKVKNSKANLESSVVWNRAKESNQNFLYVEGLDTSHNGTEYAELSYHISLGADFFLLCDFKPYQE